MLALLSTAIAFSGDSARVCILILIRQGRLIMSGLGRLSATVAAAGRRLLLASAVAVDRSFGAVPAIVARSRANRLLFLKIALLPTAIGTARSARLVGTAIMLVGTVMKLVPGLADIVSLLIAVCAKSIAWFEIGSRPMAKASAPAVPFLGRSMPVMSSIGRVLLLRTALAVTVALVGRAMLLAVVKLESASAKPLLLLLRVLPMTAMPIARSVASPGVKAIARPSTVSKLVGESVAFGVSPIAIAIFEVMGPSRAMAKVTGSVFLDRSMSAGVNRIAVSLLLATEIGIAVMARLLQLVLVSAMVRVMSFVRGFLMTLLLMVVIAIARVMP